MLRDRLRPVRYAALLFFQDATTLHFFPTTIINTTVVVLQTFIVISHYSCPEECMPYVLNDKRGRTGKYRDKTMSANIILKQQY